MPSKVTAFLPTQWWQFSSFAHILANCQPVNHECEKLTWRLRETSAAAVAECCSVADFVRCWCWWNVLETDDLVIMSSWWKVGGMIWCFGLFFFVFLLFQVKLRSQRMAINVSVLLFLNTPVQCRHPWSRVFREFPLSHEFHSTEWLKEQFTHKSKFSLSRCPQDQRSKTDLKTVYFHHFFKA